MRREFMDFLYENDSYDDFCYELYTQRDMTFKKYMQLAENTPRKLMEMAFNWHGKNIDDVDMANFWQLLNEKWIEYLES